MRLLRELSRRKLRTTLTISGITIGIWALVVFSSMANQINGLVGMGTEFYADKITVTDGVAFGTSPMRLTDADTIAEVDGVAAVDPRVELMWEADPAVGFSVPDMLNGGIPGADAGYESFELELATGRMLTAEDAGNVVVLGSSLARVHGAVAGSSIEIRGEAFDLFPGTHGVRRVFDGGGGFLELRQVGHELLGLRRAKPPTRSRLRREVEIVSLCVRANCRAGLRKTQNVRRTPTTAEIGV